MQFFPPFSLFFFLLYTTSILAFQTVTICSLCVPISLSPLNFLSACFPLLCDSPRIFHTVLLILPRLAGPLNWKQAVSRLSVWGQNCIWPASCCIFSSLLWLHYKLVNSGWEQIWKGQCVEEGSKSWLSLAINSKKKKTTKKNPTKNHITDTHVKLCPCLHSILSNPLLSILWRQGQAI